MENYRIILLAFILALSISDLLLTYYYVKTYKSWNPNKLYSEIELNPLLVFLWNNLGLLLGMVVGSLIILTLEFIVVKTAHWSVSVILLLLLVIVLFNHNKNIDLLNELVVKYPLGIVGGSK